MDDVSSLLSEVDWRVEEVGGVVGKRGEARAELVRVRLVTTDPCPAEKLLAPR